jgi:CubicO group peptidase (beta-lactamase class C family)
MSPILSAVQDSQFDKALMILQDATDSQQVRAASIFLQRGNIQMAHSFGEAKTPDASFLLGSISKPIAMAALLTLLKQEKFALDDLVSKHIPQFQHDAQGRVTIRHLLTHTSGLPDQLPNNADLRSRHAKLSEFVEQAITLRPHFEPGSQYKYSSMGILLAAEIAQRLSGKEIRELVDHVVLQPLGMQHSALGVGKLDPGQSMSCQVEFGAVESGAGSVESKSWDWNSPFWRKLGAPWGGVQASAPDVGRFLREFLHPTGTLFPPDVARLMIANHNPTGMESRGLGFDVGMESACKGCSSLTFGHTGSTGTIAWADPARDLICVVLTTLPARALTANEHPRQLASDCFGLN